MIYIDGNSYSDPDEAVKVIGNGKTTNEIYCALIFSGTRLFDLNGHKVRTDFMNMEMDDSTIRVKEAEESKIEEYNRKEEEEFRRCFSPGDGPI